MEIQGDYSFPGAPGAVFDALTSPSVLQRALPGCEEFREVGPGQYRVTMAISIIVNTIKVSGDVSFSDLDRPAGYRIEVRGSGSAGTLHVDGRFRLAPAPEGTIARYTLAIETTGALGMLGTPIIEPAAKLILGQFFGALSKELGPSQEHVATVPVVP